VELEEDVVVDDVLNVHIIKEWIIPKKIATPSMDSYSFHGFLDQTANVSKFEVV